MFIIFILCSISIFATSGITVKFNGQFDTEDLNRDNGIYLNAILSDMMIPERIDKGYVTIEKDPRIIRWKNVLGMRWNDLVNRINQSGGTLKINKAFVITFKDYAVDKDLNKLTMVVRDDIEVKNPSKAKYNEYSKLQSHPNPVNDFVTFNYSALWFGSNMSHVTHNIDIKFIKEDGTLYRGDSVMSIQDLDQPIEDFSIEQSRIKNHTIYVPEYKSKWLLTVNDFYKNGTIYTKIKGGTQDNDNKYKSGFLFIPDMSDGHIRYTLDNLDASSCLWFIKIFDDPLVVENIYFNTDTNSFETQQVVFKLEE